jgi:hypothetical protein
MLDEQPKQRLLDSTKLFSITEDLSDDPDEEESEKTEKIV